MIRYCWLLMFLAAAPALSQESPAQAARRPAGMHFQESFDDADLLKRGWYDGDRFTIAKIEGCQGKGCIEYAWKAMTTTPHSSSGVRRLFEPSDVVYLKFSIKLSQDFAWTGRDYHPHLMHFMTTENGKYHGPAASHLTVYIEPQNGKLRLAAQDIQNQDAPRGLTQGPLRGRGWLGTECRRIPYLFCATIPTIRPQRLRLVLRDWGQVAGEFC